MKAYFWLTFCVVVWGSNFVIGKILIDFFSPSALTLLRFFFITIFLISITVPKYKLTKPNNITDWLLIILLGVIGVFFNQWTFFFGLETADSTIAALILALTPIVTGFLAIIFLKEHVSAKMILGSFIAVVGIYFVVTKGQFTGYSGEKGIFWIILTMISFALMIIIVRFLSQRLNAFLITLYSNIIAVLCALIFFLFDPTAVVISPNIGPWLLLIVSAIVVHGVANLIWNIYIRHVDASKASILSNLEPFVAMIAGIILISKPITFVEFFGGLLIVSGVIFSTYTKKVNPSDLA